MIFAKRDVCTDDRLENDMVYWNIPNTIIKENDKKYVDVSDRNKIINKVDMENLRRISTMELECARINAFNSDKPTWKNYKFPPK